MNISLSDEQIEQVFSNLEHKRVYKRLQAVRDLAHVSDNRVIPCLIKPLSDAGRSGPSYQERVCDVAADVLEQLNVPQANEVVNNWRTDPFPFFRKVLDWYDDQYEIPALRELSKLDGDRVVEALMYAMGGYSQNAFEIACDEITRRGKVAIPRLVKYLDEDNAFRRMNAAYLLGKIGDSTVVPELIAALHDPKAKVRGAVAEALGALGDVRAIESLVRRLSDKAKRDPYFPDRICDVAAKSLQRIGTPEALQAVEEWHSLGTTADLIKALRSGDPHIVRSAVWSAGRLKVEEAVEPLLSILHSNDPEIKRGAIWTLGVLGDPHAVSYLLPYANDEDPQIVNAVRESLQKSGHTPD